jgi:hypothetical protein
LRSTEINAEKGGIDYEGDSARNSVAVHQDKCRNVPGDADKMLNKKESESLHEGRPMANFG